MGRNRDDDNLKSWVLLIFGLAGIAYQQKTGEVDWLLLAIFTSMAGVPGIARVISLLKNSPTIMQSSLSQEQSSEPDSDNLSQDSSDEER